MVAVSSASVRLHPLVLINITDQVTRRDFAVAVSDNSAASSSSGNDTANSQSQDFIVTSAGVLLGSRTATAGDNSISSNSMVVENNGGSERIQVNNSFELKFGVRTEEENMAMGGMDVQMSSMSSGEDTTDGSLPFLQETGNGANASSSATADTCRPAANPFVGESDEANQGSGQSKNWRMASQPFDKDFLNQRADQYREVFPRLQIVGWYVSVVRIGEAARAAAEKSRIARENASNGASKSRGDERSINLEGVERYLEQQPGFQQISQVIQSKAGTPNPLLLVFDDRCGSGGSADLPLRVFSYGQGGPSPFAEVVTASVVFEESEQIAVTDVATTASGGQSQYEQHKTVLTSAIRVLDQRIGMILDFLKESQGKDFKDHALLREAKAMCLQLDYMRGLQNRDELDDNLAVVHLGAVTKVVAHGRDTNGRWREKALAEALDCTDSRKRAQESEDTVPPGVPNSLMPMRIGYE